MPWDLDELEDDCEYAMVSPQEKLRLERLVSCDSDMACLETCLDKPEVDCWDDMPTEPTAIIFLSIDGVLHSLEDAHELFFASPRMEQLRRILDATGARIVLSSKWRLTACAASVAVKSLANAGLPRPIDATPDLSQTGEGRAEEIGAWLDDNSEIVDWGRWVAIDYLPLYDSLPPENVVTTDSDVGLTPELADEAIAKLCNPKMVM